MSLEVTRKSIQQILALLHSGEWQIPQFQRDFIWTQEQVKKLIYSFIASYPIGLITVWDQPQNNPYTPGEPLSLKDGSEFRQFDVNPAVIKLVLDGKQRLTTLAMVFGGFRSQNDRFSYSGGWYLDLDALSKEDEANIIIYKKQREIGVEDLNVQATCVRKGMIPFRDFNKLGEYLQNIHNPEIYPEGIVPDKELRDKRASLLNDLTNNFNQFQIPIAEIPSTVDLGAVCEIFDVLNTTGTKVSTFDLIHNKMFKESNGSFLLRDKFYAYKDLTSFGQLCDDNRQEYISQVVTGCYLLEESPVKASNPREHVTSIKGRDLIETPLKFYMFFDANIQKVDSYTSDLFSNILESDFKLSQVPYPVSMIIYLSLRWHLELRLGPGVYNVEELNKIFKAFFWRNTLTGRYDQGFLTQFAKDINALDAILKASIVKRHDNWNTFINTELEAFFGIQYKSKEKEEIIELIKDDEIRGALRQGVALLLHSKAQYDLLTGERLNKFSEERGKKVQLHHIFPRDWCANNRGRHAILETISENNLGNLIPMTASSNNAWKANSPATAIQNNHLEFIGHRQTFEAGLINLDAYNMLAQDDVRGFWDNRINRIADELYNLQFVS